jgi:hypothetical protein
VVEAKSIFSGESTAVMMLAKTFLAFLHRPRINARRVSQPVVAGDPMVAMTNTVRDTGVQSI